ncbi:MAG: hypothetical protein ACN6QI_22165, partial [Pseudomonas sp.]|uniref:hypothetical protein n=1 Tax=Pseudomonas sp. TaxID=306 RepID=UPI003D0CEE82
AAALPMSESMLCSENNPRRTLSPYLFFSPKLMICISFLLACGLYIEFKGMNNSPRHAAKFWCESL